MTLNKLAVLHQSVIHSSKTTETDIELENIWVMKYPYDLLKHVCVDCFSEPDQEVGVGVLVEG